MADGRLTFDTKLNSNGLVKGLNGIGSMATNAVKGVAKIGSAAVVAGATASAALVKSAVDSYASYEQLVGGIETLFGAGGKTLEEYAKSVGKSTESAKKDYEQLMKAQEIALDNADQAYKTAGMSANDYMETVTGLAASLKQSTKNETEAAKAADQAIIDMSDNANKMGTSMESIQNAYAGFSKQNYTMLDNLKLGYGGTKTEMERLLADAEKLKKAQGENVSYSIDSFADVVEAIHVVQDEMGITGTTAKEASTTIEGSINSAKAAWENLLVGMADEDADLDALIDNFVESVEIAADNIIPVIEKALSGLSTLIGKLAPTVAKGIPQFVENILPKLLNAGGLIVAEFIKELPGMLSKILPAIEKSIKLIFQTLAKNAPKEFQPIIKAVSSLANKIIPILKKALSTLVLALKRLGVVVSNVVKYFTEHQTAAKVLASTIAGVTVAIIAYRVAQEASNIISAASLMWTKLQIAHLALQEGATLSAALAQAELNTVMAANPIGLVIAGVAGLTAGLIALVSATSNDTTATDANTEARRRRLEELDTENKALEEQNRKLQENAEQTLVTAQEDAAYMGYIQELANELFGLADETGRVKDADKARADFILNELNGALGTEYELTGNQIGQYQKLQGEIYKTINAKTNELLLADYEEQYTEAVKNRKTAQKEVNEAQEKSVKENEKYNKVLEENTEKIKKLKDMEIDYSDSRTAEKQKENRDRSIATLQKEIDTQKELADTAKQTYKDTSEKANMYYAEIIQYQSAYQAAAEGNAEKAQEILTTSIDEFKSIGGYITEGIANGMSNKKAQKELNTAVDFLVDNTLGDLKKKLGIHSPSKEFKWLGQMCIEGFDEPFEDYNPYDNLNSAMKANKNTLKMNYNAGLSLDGYVDYGRMGNELVDVLSRAGLTVQVGEREFGRIVRKVL
nr:MAG TPA: tail tape measure protein [Caudoviricetes sp.]